MVLIPLTIYPDIFNAENIDSICYFLASVIFGSLFPDIDEENSYIGSKFKVISKPLNLSIGHRTYTHNLFVYMFISIYAFYQEEYILLGFCIGSILHVLEDSVTNNGVKGALRPFFQRFVLLPSQMRFQTNGLFENIFYLPMISIAVFFELYILSLHILPTGLFN